MPLPTPALDNRRFQEIVTEAKRLIPQYCPEWTDHNESDPGVALIQLFAWMTEMLLYRVNQVPDKNYIKFLELIGIKLDPPRSAGAPITFYLSAPQPNDIVIPKGTEVASVRTETNPAIVFTTEADLTLRPAVVLGAFTRSVSEGEAGWVTHDLKRLTLPNQSIALFPNPPVPGDSFYLALEKDHSHHVCSLIVGCENAGGQGVDPTNPPLEWQVWQGGSARWVPCALEHDGTGGFNRDGQIILHLPAMSIKDFYGMRAYWLRCRLTAAQAGPCHYDISPELERQLDAETRGGTVTARHAITVTDEILGYSDGSPGQVFRFLNTPLLTRVDSTDYLNVVPAGVEPEQWREVADFADSGPEDRHFTIDSLDGLLALGPSLLQPDGKVYRFGAIPPKGSVLRYTRYQYGGGVVGNVPKGALSVLKSSIPYISQVINREAAVGGRNAQSLDDAKLRAAQTLRTRDRAVTAGDYEYLACQVPGVARARCLAPGAQVAEVSDAKPGEVIVIVLPDISSEVKLKAASIPAEQVVLSAELRQTALNYLNERCVLGCRVQVRAPRYIWVQIRAKLRLFESHQAFLATQVQECAQVELYRYLNPYSGGPHGDGWSFGRDLHVSELYGILQRIPFVEFVEEVEIRITEPGAAMSTQPGVRRVAVPADSIICSAQHSVTVRYE